MDYIIDVDYNISKAEAKQRKLDREMQLSEQKAKLIKQQMKQTAENIELSKQKQKQLNDELDRSAQKLDKYRYGELNLSDKQLKSEQRNNAEIQKKIAAEEAYQVKAQAMLAKQNIQLDTQNAKTAEIGDKILSNSKNQNKFTKAFEKSSKSAERFGKRVKSLIASALFFSVLTKAFTALREEFGKLITQAGSKTATLISQLNGNLAVLGRTIYESARPYIEWLLEKLVKITQILTYGIAKILGISVDEMKKLTKSTEEAGKEAKKTTAEFDTLKTIDTSSGESSSDDSGVGTRYDALNSGIDNEIAILMATISGALLVLGVILTFTGTNIPLGLGLIAVGAIGLATSLTAAWDTLPEKIKNVITAIMAIGGALFIVLGLVLILTGAGFPLGIGLILLGAGLLYGAISLTPGDSFLEKVKYLCENVKKIIKNFIKWLRENLFDKVFGTEFGEVLDGMFDDWCLLWEDVAGFFYAIVEGDWDKMWKSLGNIAIDLLNWIIDGFNLMTKIKNGWFVKALNKVGEIFGADLDVKTTKIPNIPRLATGAVIPGGSPFLAMLGDQKKGQTNIEAPLETIVEAFKIAQPSNKFIIEATGSMAPLISLLNLKIKEENKRATIF